ncbi:mate-domain-containing protein [Cunninghamella echinulata]|nr:mate-domain-containing protein [Cunninghamella echinulata]
MPTERTPLVQSLKFDNDNDSTWKAEFLWLAKNCLPIIGTYLLQNSLQFASVITLGHLGSTELAGAALGSMFASVSAWSTCFGVASALDTLCSQAWTGAKDKTLVGLHLQRALLILAIMFIPIATIWLNATSIFIYLKQEPELAFHAGLFLKYLLIGAPFYIGFECVKKYLQAQGIMKASSYVLIIVAPINLIMNYTFVYPFKLGFIGAPLATSVSYMLMLGLLLIYINFVDGKQAWGGWKRECLLDWGTFLKLAYPGIISISAEWWAFELSALAAAFIGTVDLAAQSILLTSAGATYTFPFGVSVAASNRVGNCLGAMSPLKAKRAAGTALCFAVLFGIANSVFFIATRSWFGYSFTSDEDVVKKVAVILPICGLFQIADGLAGVSGGVIRG